MSSCPALRIALVAALVARSLASAQTVLAEYGFPGPYGSVGTRVGVAGDIDGDGVQDVLAAGPVGVFTYSGAGGEQLGYLDAQFGLSSTSTEMNHVTGTGDLDGDGQRDVVVAEGDSVRAYSRATSGLLWTYPGSAGGSIGWRMGVLGDVSGDGVDDLVVGEPSADPLGLFSAGKIHVLSGANGSALAVHAGTQANQGFGRAVAAFADLDGDGNDDILVGDSNHEVHGVNVGRILVLSAVSGAKLLEIGNEEPTPNFAIEVASAGDLDGDAVPDLVVRTVIGPAQLQAWSGASGELLWSSGNINALRIVAVGDGNGDGASEIVAAGPGYLTTPGNGQVHDGATGVVLKSFFGDSPASYVSLAAPGDTDGDGAPELLAGTGAATNFTQVLPNADLIDIPGFTFVKSFVNPAGGTGLGGALDFAGDFDGDGRQDYLLLSSKDLVVFAADDGETLVQIPHGATQSFLGSSASSVAGPGDLDGDGVPDFVLGEGYHDALPGPAPGRLRVFSGADGAVLDEILGPDDSLLGEWVVDVADRDGDGVRDLLVSLRETDVGGVVDAGEVWLLSGATRDLLQVYHAEIATSRRFGYGVRGAGDLDGDGVEDLLAGSYNTGAFPLYNTPALYVLSGASGAILYKLTGDTSATIAYGASIGDATGDGVPDLLMTEPSYYLGSTGSAGRARLYSGADGSLEWTRTGTLQYEQFGFQRSAAGDVDGDGYGDVAVSALPSTTGGRVHILSGRDGSTLDSIDLMPGTALQSASFLPVGLVDAGGCADLLVGVPLLYGNGGARLYASSQGGVWGFVDLGHAKPGSNGQTPTLAAYGDLSANGLATIAARHAKPNATGLWMIGLDTAYVPFKHGTLVPDPTGLFFSFAVAVDGAGELLFTAPNPSSVFLGLELIHQFWWGDAGVPGKLSASNGLREIFK